MLYELTACRGDASTQLSSPAAYVTPPYASQAAFFNLCAAPPQLRCPQEPYICRLAPSESGAGAGDSR